MKKLNNYINYLLEYLRYGDIFSLYDCVSFITFKHPNASDRLVKSRTGWFYCRKHTDDFKHASFAKDRSVKKFLLRNINRFDIFLDIGSGIGEWSILLANKQIRCHAFEPVTVNYHSLLKNIKLNSLSHVIKPYSFGLGDRTRQESFVFFPCNIATSCPAARAAEANCSVEIHDIAAVIEKINISPADRVLIRFGENKLDAEIVSGARDFIASSPKLMLLLRKDQAEKANLRQVLDGIAKFEYSMLDDYNLIATKLN
jgi:FkbM family methyltransferase